MKKIATLLPVIWVCAFACGDDEVAANGTDPHRPYEEGATTVIGGSKDAPVISGSVSDAGCLQIDDDTCIAVEREGKFCKADDGPVDAVVVGGAVVQVVCYEDTDGNNGETVVIDADQDGDLDLPQQANGSVIVFGDGTGTSSISGNVNLDANDVTLFGNGPDLSVIDGNLTITGNNARVRGVRVRGNLIVSLNTAAVVFVVVEGNLIVGANNALVAESEVYGKLEVTGNNAILVNNDVQGDWSITGGNATCDGNTAFDDANDDDLIAAGERGAALTCR